MLNIGIAGLGLMGQMHARHFNSHPMARVAALCDADPDRRLGRFSRLESNLDAWQKDGEAELGDVRPYVDPRELCRDEQLDVIAICLPSDLHAELAIDALEHGKHVFCEKPIALHPSEGRRMLDAARAHDRTLMIGHCLRFWPEYVEVDHLIRSESYGRAIAASFTRCSPRPAWSQTNDNWLADPNRCGGVGVDLHIHDADLAVWWWGKPDHLKSQGTFLGPMLSTIHSQWSYREGPIVLFEGCWEPVTTSPFFFNFKVTFEDAMIVFDSRDQRGLQLATGDELRCIEVQECNAYELQDRYFIDCLVGGKPVERCLPEDSLLTLECVEQSTRQIITEI